MTDSTIAFGPVPSRRLGQSLGINHIPPKHCPYACVYCQVGRTTSLRTLRQSFFPVKQIIQEVERKILANAKTGRAIDYLTLVPDGEPTLDINLEELIDGLKIFGIPIAVISNSALIDHQEVQAALLKADWVSLKVDCVDETGWRQINRPHGSLSLSAILAGIHQFRNKFHGDFVTETMLISEINDNETSLNHLAEYLLALNPSKSYLSLPTRPPVESWVKPPLPETLQKIFQIMTDKVPFVDFLFEDVSMDFVSTGNIVADILAITAVHPLREEALRNMVSQANTDWAIIAHLVAYKELVRVQYRGEWFYFRSFFGSAGKK